MGKVLVIGYGNTLRSDDGVGPRTVEALEALCSPASGGQPSFQFHLPGVETLVCDLLTPELADPISRATRVFFVDASVEAPREVQVRKVEPNPSCQLMAHAADPRTMLALARDVFGHAPEAWCITIPVEDMGIGDKLSAFARAGMQRALSELRARIAVTPQ